MMKLGFYISLLGVPSYAAIAFALVTYSSATGNNWARWCGVFSLIPMIISAFAAGLFLFQWGNQ